MSPQTLTILPCRDDDGMAAARRRELDISRAVARSLGHSAVQAAERGAYTLPDGREVDWHADIHAACQARCSLPPEAPLPSAAPPAFETTTVQVSNETTQGAARRLTVAGQRPLALNFANGIHPGGGFLTGSRAQEETLCRSSALYLTLRGDPMYAAHRARPTPDSTAWSILSPDVPFFREDDGRELDVPWRLAVLTCAAPVVPQVGQPLAGDLLQARIVRVLEIAQAYGYSSLVLGAWGCGAFGNDPHRTAHDFRAALEGPFAHVFAHVAFAITDWSPERRFLGPFRDVFSVEDRG